MVLHELKEQAFFKTVSWKREKWDIYQLFIEQQEKPWQHLIFLYHGWRENSIMWGSDSKPTRQSWTCCFWNKQCLQKVHQDAVNTHPALLLSLPFTSTWAVRTLRRTFAAFCQPGDCHIPFTAQKCQGCWTEIWIIHFISRVSFLFLKVIWKIK